jgi:quercetin dioxygenase-like cupin family protein
MNRIYGGPFAFQWEGLPLEVLSDWVARRGVHGHQLTLAQFVMKKGYIVDRHSHPNEQITLVLRGALRLDFETGESCVLHDGEFVVVPPGLVHWGVVLEDTVDFDAFVPPRSDWWTSSGETYYTTGNREGRTWDSLSHPSSHVGSGTAPQRVFTWEHLPAEAAGSGIERRSVRGQKQSFSRFVFAAGARYEGMVEAERAVWVIEGAIRYSVGVEAPATLLAGHCLFIPPNVPLRLEAVETAVCLEVVASPIACVTC